MVRRPSSRGFVLPLVAILLFALTLLFTTLLKSAGRLNPVLARYKSDFETFYKAESAVLLHLQGFPSDYYQDLPRVQAEPFGPWEKICTVGDAETHSAPLCVVAGTEPQNVSFWDWNSGASNYRTDLEKRIQESAAEKSLYGNRRYFQGETFMSGAIHQGDLEMSFSDTVRSANFWVDGTTLVRGQAHFDTLRLYTLGDVVFQGEVSVGYLELVSRGTFRAEGDARFSGIVLSSSFQLQDRAQGLFPIVMVSAWGEMFDGSILPAFVDGRRKVWGRL